MGTTKVKLFEQLAEANGTFSIDKTINTWAEQKGVRVLQVSLAIGSATETAGPSIAKQEFTFPMLYAVVVYEVGE